MNVISKLTSIKIIHTIISKEKAIEIPAANFNGEPVLNSVEYFI